MMKQKWLVFRSKFESFEVRERMLIVGAIIALSYIFWDMVFMQSMSKQLKELLNRESKASMSITTVKAEVAVFETALKRDPNAVIKAELKVLEEKLAELDKNLEMLSVGLVTADKLPIMLHDVLEKTKKLKLVNMMTLPVEEVQIGLQSEDSDSENESRLDNDELENNVLVASIKDSGHNYITASEDEKAETVRLFKHGVSLTFTGTYQNVSEYVHDLENGTWRFYWDVLGYTVATYPKAEIHLQVFTLSSELGAFDGG